MKFLKLFALRLLMFLALVLGTLALTALSVFYPLELCIGLVASIITAIGIYTWIDLNVR